MNKADIVTKLDERLAELYALRDVLNGDKQKLLESVYTPEIKARMAEIEAEFSPGFDALNESIERLETEIKAEVVSLGESVKGKSLHAVYTKGRVSWDTKALDGFATAHPEILKLRKEGEPSVSLRFVK